jgi:pimeloyl-ACP methyl ester carboxylesterase
MGHHVCRQLRRLSCSDALGRSLRLDLSRAVLAAALLSAVPAGADDGPAYGPQLEGYAYPWPVEHFTFASQGAALDMAYVDVKPKTPNGRTIVLLHGKNFCAATWQGSIAALTAAGYRVIAPDQIGFCKSTKPAHYQYSFQQLAANTHALLARLGVSKATIMGHSTGGMLGIRYALMYPQNTDQLVLVDPIGLEDWKAKGVPWQSVDAWYQRELNTTAEHIRDYERTTYYAGTWKPEYEPWVEMLAGLYRGPGHEIVAWNSALLYDMIFTQPVFYELDRDRGTGAADDRRQGHDRDRQGAGAAGDPRHAGQLSGAREGRGRAHPPRASRRIPRARPRAADPSAGRVPQSAARGPARRRLDDARQGGE